MFTHLALSLILDKTGKPLGLEAGVLLASALALTEVAANADGWFEWTLRQCEDETQLSARRQERLFPFLEDAGLIETTRRHSLNGVRHVRLKNRSQLAAALQEQKGRFPRLGETVREGIPRNVETGFHEMWKPESENEKGYHEMWKPEVSVSTKCGNRFPRNVETEETVREGIPRNVETGEVAEKNVVSPPLSPRPPISTSSLEESTLLIPPPPPLKGGVSPPVKKTRLPEDNLEFLTFYAHYPRKVARPAAWKAWCKLNPTLGIAEAIMAGLVRSIEEWRGEEVRFIPHPATWLHERRWEDEATPVLPQEVPPLSLPMLPTLPETPISGRYASFAESVGAVRHGESERDWGAKLLLVAFRLIRYPDQERYSASDWKTHRENLRVLIDDGVTPEVLGIVTRIAVDTWSDRERVTLRSVQSQFSTLMEQAQEKARQTGGRTPPAIFTNADQQAAEAANEEARVQAQRDKLLVDLASWKEKKRVNAKNEHDEPLCPTA